MLKTLTFGLFLLTLTTPVKAQNRQFDQFLHDFRYMYAMYHMGPALPAGSVNQIAERIWNGSGRDWVFASTTACQGICESHYQLSGNKHLKYRGHIGMHLNTIFAEGVRTGLIKKNKHDLHWILGICKKDPSYADFLAASRLVFLTRHFGSLQVAVFQYVTGHGYKSKKRVEREKNLKRATRYWATVQKLRLECFGVPLTGQ